MDEAFAVDCREHIFLPIFRLLRECVVATSACQLIAQRIARLHASLRELGIPTVSNPANA